MLTAVLGRSSLGLARGHSTVTRSVYDLSLIPRAAQAAKDFMM